MEKKVKGERWWTGETLSASIGQSYLLVSPIQIARMISSIFTGYLVTPRFLVDEPITQEPLDIEPATRTFLKQSMKAVIKQGSGQSVSTIKDMVIYAKTVRLKQVHCIRESLIKNIWNTAGLLLICATNKKHRSRWFF